MPEKENDKIYYAAKVGCLGELRSAGNEPQDESERKVSGLAMRFNNPTVLFTINGIDYKEIIDPHALDECKMDDVVFDRGHDMDNALLARTKNETLKLSVTDSGLEFEAMIADTQVGRDTYELVKRGDISECSFAAIVREDSYDTQTHTRTIHKFEEIIDVAAVTFPAYGQTEITAEMRSKFGIVEMQQRAQAENADFEFRKAKMLASLC